PRRGRSFFRRRREMTDVKFHRAFRRVFFWLIAAAIALPAMPALAEGELPRRYGGFGGGLPSTVAPETDADDAPAGPPADPFQRYVIFHNQLPVTVYPVITA